MSSNLISSDLNQVVLEGVEAPHGLAVAARDEPFVQPSAVRRARSGNQVDAGNAYACRRQPRSERTSSDVRSWSGTNYKVGSIAPSKRPLSASCNQMAFQASGFGPLVNQAPHSLLAYCPEDVSAAQSKGSQGGQGPEARHARELSTAATPTKRATLFLHFSGCGGTSVADFARKLHVFTMPPKTSSKNANFGCAAEQFCHNATLTATRRCPCADTQRAAARGLTWWANENPSLAPLRCPSVSYWTVIRDPVDRIFSRVRVVWYC